MIPSFEQQTDLSIFYTALASDFTAIVISHLDVRQPHQWVTANSSRWQQVLTPRASLKVWNAFSELGHDMASRDFQMFQGVLISLEVRRFKSSGHQRQPICQWNLKVNNLGDPEVLLYLYVKPLNREGLVIPAVLVSCWLFLFSLPLHDPSTHCESPPGLFINSRFTNLAPSRCRSTNIIILLLLPFLLLVKIRLKGLFCKVLQWIYVNNKHISKHYH